MFIIAYDRNGFTRQHFIYERKVFQRKLRIQAAVRLLATIVLNVNAQLVAAGMNPIPFDETIVTKWATYIVAFLMIGWSWWKDAPMTKEAILAHLSMLGEKLFNKLTKEAQEELSNGKGDDQE